MGKVTNEKNLRFVIKFLLVELISRFDSFQYCPCQSIIKKEDNYHAIVLKCLFSR